MHVRTWIVVAGITGALAVAFGAFGSHMLPGWLARSGLSPDEISHRMAIFQTGARYHMYHALALLAIASLGRRVSGRGLLVSGVAMLAGIIIFSGVLYALALTGITVLGAIVPIGGVLLIVGWLALAFAAVGGG